MNDKLTPLALLLAGLLLAPAVSSAADARASFGMSASVTAAAVTEDCQNNPGPYISLAGEISLGGLQARLRFSNNMKGTHVHEEDVVSTIQLLSDEPIRFAKQPSHGGVGGNPHVFLLLHAPSGGPMGEPLYLGRCVQGFEIVDLETILPALVEADVLGGGCKQSGGPNITLDGGLVLGGLDATLVFTNSDQSFVHVHEEDVTVGLSLIPEGTTLTFPKQPPLGGAGGNPHVFLQFQNGDGSPIADEVYLGRCSKL